LTNLELEDKLKFYTDLIPYGYYHVYSSGRRPFCIVPEDMQLGFYECAGRNFHIGYWDGKEFQGLRTKFGNTFVTNEVHWDLHDRYGTVQPLRLIDF